MREYKVCYSDRYGNGKWSTTVDANNRTEVRAYFKKFYPTAKITSIKLQ